MLSSLKFLTSSIQRKRRRNKIVRPSIQMMISVIAAITLMILQTTEADQKLIETTCRNTPDYNLCTAIIRGKPGAEGADVAGLGLIVVDVVKQKSDEALSIITKSGQQKVLGRCTDSYKAVVEGDVPVVKQSIRGNPKFAETAMADAAAEADICDGSLRGKLPELSNVNKYVARVAQVARAIIRNLL